MKEGFRRFLIDGKEFFVPRSLEYCRTPEMVSSVVAYTIAERRVISSKEKVLLKVKTFCDLTGVPMKLIEKLTPAQVQRLLGMTAWVKYAKVGERQPFEFFEHDGKKYFLPAERLADTSAIEMAMLTIYYLAFTRENNPNFDAVFSFVATVCRVKRTDIDLFRKSEKWNGDIREVYNSNVADETAKKLRTAQAGMVMAVFYYVSEMIQAFWKRYDGLLDGGDEEEQIYQNGEGQITMLMDIAEMGTFGNFEQVCQQNVHTIYIFLKDKKLKFEKAKRKQELENDGDD